MNELVSIVIPTYNRSHIISKTIKSCLKQTYKNLEVIIVNDGSSDNTYDEIEQFFNDPRIKYVEQSNMGTPGALNTGFRLASGNYYTWISDDNYFMEDAIEIMVKEVNKYDKPVFVYTNIYIHYIDTGEIKLLDLSKDNSLYIDNCIGACFMYPKEIAEVIGEYSEEFRLAEDYDYWLRVSFKFPLVHIPKTPYIFTDHKDSLTNSSKEKSREIVSKLREHHNLQQRLISDIMKNAKDRKLFIWGTGSGAENYINNLSKFSNIQIEGFIEGLKKNIKNSFQGLRVYKPSLFKEKYIKEVEKPYILIAVSYKYREEIIEELNSMGLEIKRDYYFLYNTWV